jgi:hypothetical protein
VLALAQPAAALDHSHQRWNALLQRHVVLLDGGKASRLDYAALAQERAALLAYLEGLSRVSEAFGRFFANPFRDPFFSLLGERMSLDTIEHEILRKKYSDPRIHYAVNCASIGCPMLREEAYVAVHLERQLEEQAARFLSDRTRNRLRDGRLEVSKIFDWFKEDFEPRDKYFQRYAGILGVPPGASPPLVFLDYDWSLNDSRSSSPR